MAGNGNGGRGSRHLCRGRFRRSGVGRVTRYLRGFPQVRAVTGRGNFSVTLIAAVTPARHGFPPWLILVGLAVITPAGYALSCWWFPFARCLVCKGTGRRARKDGKVWRRCRWCRGSGRRLRIGRRVWTWATVLRRDAS